MTLIICPICKRECATNAPSKVYSVIKPYFRQHLKAKEYGFCNNPNCDVVYCGIDSDEIYFKRDLEEEMK